MDLRIGDDVYVNSLGWCKVLTQDTTGWILETSHGSRIHTTNVHEPISFTWYSQDIRVEYKGVTSERPKTLNHRFKQGRYVKGEIYVVHRNDKDFVARYDIADCIGFWETLYPDKGYIEERADDMAALLNELIYD